MSNVSHIGVVGAGLSGLRCADLLLQIGFRVTILEARDRIGGRVCQSDVGGIPVDLGPNWIHGTDNNPLVEISRDSGTVTHSWDEGHAIIDRDGCPLDKTTSAKIEDFVWTTIEKAFEYSRKEVARISSSESLFDYFTAEVEKSQLSQAEKEACLEVSKLWGSYIGAPVNRQSLKYFFLEECLEGVNLFVASTYKNILRAIAEPALADAEIRLCEPVVAIDAQPRTPGTKHKVQVQTAPGNRYTFDEIVTTFPLGWLKQNKSIFTPPLPGRLSQAIDSISYGKLEKVYVHFPSAFWHTARSFDNREEEETQSKPENFSEDIPPSTQFMTPKYTTHPSTPFWNQDCVPLSSFPDHCSHPTLLFYLYPPCSTHLVNALSSLPHHSPAYNSTLNDFFHPYYSRLPNYSPTAPECQPLAFLATSWQTDSYAGNGSYSNFQVGLEDGDRDIEIMREGIGAERGVWFAGEHTAPFVALGTTLGAYWSGEQVARRVIDAFERNSKR